jgi:hypothetical protein
VTFQAANGEARRVAIGTSAVGRGSAGKVDRARDDFRKRFQDLNGAVRRELRNERRTMFTNPWRGVDQWQQSRQLKRQLEGLDTYLRTQSPRGSRIGRPCDRGGDRPSSAL